MQWEGDTFARLKPGLQTLMVLGMLDPQEALGVGVKDFSFGGFVGRQAADAGQNLRAIALRAAAHAVITVSPEEQFFLMLGDEPAGVLFIASLEIQAGTCRGVSIHVRVIAQEAV